MGTHCSTVQELLDEGTDAHRELLARLPADIAVSLPVDGQGVTRAIDHLAAALGFSYDQRLKLVTPHAVNPAVLHARVFGAAWLTEGTVIGAFVEGARVRADALVTLADAAGDEQLLADVRHTLIDHPLPVVDGQSDDLRGGAAAPGGDDPAAALRDAYAAQERAALLIAAALDGEGY